MFGENAGITSAYGNRARLLLSITLTLIYTMGNLEAHSRCSNENKKNLQGKPERYYDHLLG
jgi:hypothetical protein